MQRNPCEQWATHDWAQRARKSCLITAWRDGSLHQSRKRWRKQGREEARNRDMRADENRLKKVSMKPCLQQIFLLMYLWNTNKHKLPLIFSTDTHTKKQIKKKNKAERPGGELWQQYKNLTSQKAYKKTKITTNQTRQQLIL